jgi:N-acyl-D-amino-acid deacylase
MGWSNIERWGLIAALATCGLPNAATARDFDLLIRGGTVIDGTGSVRRTADIGVLGDTIAAVGNLTGSTGKTEIKASGLIVAPGFIDMHAHLGGENGLDSKDVRRRAAQNFVAQGITSAAINPDGRQPDSLVDQRKGYEKNGIGVNVALFNGHNSLRAMTMGTSLERPATKAEIDKMKDILRRGLEKEGSFGLSLGVEYDSGRFSTSDELVELSRVLPEYHGVYTSHLRSQGISPMWYDPSRNKGSPPPTLEDAFKETMRTADETGAVTVITHMKGWGPGYRGQAAKWIAEVQAARDRGAKLYIDVYSFDSTGSDGTFILLPAWALGEEQGSPPPKDYNAALKAVLAEGPRALADLRLDVDQQVALKGGAENVVILDYKDRSYIGKRLSEVMKMRKMDAIEIAIALQTEGDPSVPGGIKMRSLSLDEKDVAAYYAQPWAATSTDGSIVLPEEAVGPKKYVGTNRRHFGTYPRRLAYVSQVQKADSLEEAIRKSSSLPAEILNIHDRGRLVAGMKADIVILDMETLADKTTVAEPSVYPTGVQHVFVNGVAAVKDGARTLALAGRVLDPPGRPAILP